MQVLQNTSELSTPEFTTAATHLAQARLLLLRSGNKAAKDIAGRLSPWVRRIDTLGSARSECTDEAR
jgi:hypothetical protein